jgi:hypothetical protein
MSSFTFGQVLSISFMFYSSEALPRRATCKTGFFNSNPSARLTIFEQASWSYATILLLV